MSFEPGSGRAACEERIALNRNRRAVNKWRGVREHGGERADLDEELEVDIVGLRRCALSLLVAAAGDEVDTLRAGTGWDRRDS